MDSSPSFFRNTGGGVPYESLCLTAPYTAEPRDFHFPRSSYTGMLLHCTIFRPALVGNAALSVPPHRLTVGRKPLINDESKNQGLPFREMTRARGPTGLTAGGILLPFAPSSGTPGAAFPTRDYANFVRCTKKASPVQREARFTAGQKHAGTSESFCGRGRDRVTDFFHNKKSERVQLVPTWWSIAGSNR